MKVTRIELEHILVLLEETPQRISAALMQTQRDVYFKPHTSEWSAHEVLLHLCACADVWSDTIQAMLRDSHPTLAEIHPDVYLKNGTYKEQEFVTTLRMFIDRRAALMTGLQQLHFDDWLRGGKIGGREHTIFSQARRMALHEVEHCEQIERLLA